MCGILGGINIQNTSKYLDLIKHRGPDSSGLISANVNGNTIDLLHRRLSIVDLSEAGSQPMYSIDKKRCIIFNGEIYNHLELRKKLPGMTFKGHSDTETIVNYFSNIELKDSLKDLNGIFAFAYLDLENQLLHLARDRYGVKPLYYYFNYNQLMFSSEIRPLKAFLNPEIDEGSLMLSLRMRYSPSPFTIYKSIAKVEPGQLITINLQSPITLEKSNFNSVNKSIGTIKGEHKVMVRKYGDLFEKAVERQLMSDVEVGILLSGGIDSALVAAIAKEKSKTKIKTFTIGFEGNHSDIDEINYAKETADILELENYSKRIGYTDFFDCINKIVKIAEEPLGTTSIIPMFFLSELAASKVKVVLSGQGADEPLGGYHKYKGLPWLERSRLFQPILELTKNAAFIYEKKEKLRRLISAMQCKDVINSYIEFNAISSIKEINNLINPGFRKSFLNDLAEKQESFHTKLKQLSPTIANIKNLFPYYDLRTSLADDLLMYTDKITMHFSLECRVPILDNDLINFIESLNVKYKFNSKQSKLIHKDFAKEYLPSEIIERKKLGFNSPAESWFRKHTDDIIEVFTSNQKLHKFFDINSIKNLLNTHTNGTNLEKQIFLLLSISSLIEK